MHFVRRYGREGLHCDIHIGWRLVCVGRSHVELREICDGNGAFWPFVLGMTGHWWPAILPVGEMDISLDLLQSLSHRSTLNCTNAIQHFIVSEFAKNRPKEISMMPLPECR